LGGENLTLMHLIHKIAQVIEVPTPSILFPGRLARRFAVPIHWLNPLLDLPISIDLLRLAGYGFYYHTQKAQEQLFLNPPRRSEDAIQSAYEWFKENGSL
jgi:hypothetical protein